jgi:signal transduction histidine kinase
MDRLKLKWRVFAFMLVFCALLIVILWLFQTVFLTDMYKYIRTKEIEKAVVLVGENIDSPDLQMIFRKLERDKEIIVMPAREFIPPPKPEYERDSRGRPQPMFETITKTKEFIFQGGHAVQYTFYAIITPLDATVSTLQIQLYIITVVMVLLSILIAVIISKRISKPIEDINKGAKTLSSGNYDMHFDGKGFLEIKELSDTLNAAAAELSKVENLRRELMANVSHDLRTPLSLIYSYAEMMHDFPDEIAQQQIQVIMGETKRLASLVDDILDISQIEKRSIGLCKSKYDFTSSIASTVSRLVELTKKDGYTIDFDFSENVYIDADEVKITQAVYNLLVNAINYSGEDKRIIVRQSVFGGHVKIEVIDNGMGISPDDLPFVWERYYKVDKKHKRPVAGTGLGLSIVKKIIEMHGGKYGAESEIGKGSIFWFEIVYG